MIRPLLGQRFLHVVHVAQEEVGGIDQQRAAGAFGLDIKSRQHRFGERLAHRQALRGLAGRGAEELVGLHQQHLRTDPVEAHHARIVELAAVQT